MWNTRKKQMLLLAFCSRKWQYSWMNHLKIAKYTHVTPVTNGTRHHEFVPKGHDTARLVTRNTPAKVEHTFHDAVDGWSGSKKIENLQFHRQMKWKLNPPLALHRGQYG